MPGNMIKQAKLNASQVSFSTTFNSAFAAVEDPMRVLAMEMPSTTRVEEHDWMDSVPGLSEWIDDRKLSNLSPQSIRIPNLPWASGIRIDRDDILDDRLGIIRPRIEMLAKKAALHYSKLAALAMIGGFTTTGKFGAAYDGKAFFATDHQDNEDGPIQGNTGAPAVLSKSSYYAARTQMMELTDDQGDDLDIVPNVLFCGPSNEEVAYDILSAQVGANGASNSTKGTAEVIIVPSLRGAHANKWFLSDTNQPVKPLILQIREKITSSFEDATFMNKKMKFGAEGRHNVGYALWQFMYGNKGIA